MWGTYVSSVKATGLLGTGMVGAFWLLLIVGVINGIRRSFSTYSEYLTGAWTVNCFLLILPAITLRIEVGGRAPDVAIVAQALIAVARFLCVHLAGTAFATLVVILAKPRRHARLAPMLLLILALAGWFSARFVSQTAVSWGDRSPQNGEPEGGAAAAVGVVDTGVSDLEPPVEE